VYTVHGFPADFAKHLRKRGVRAHALQATEQLAFALRAGDVAGNRSGSAPPGRCSGCSWARCSGVRVEGLDRLRPRLPAGLQPPELGRPFLLLGWLPASPRVHFLGRRSAIYNRPWKRWVLDFVAR